MTRAAWEAQAMRRQFGDVLATKRIRERREAFAVWLGDERRKAERRAADESAAISNWIRRYEESRNALA